MTKRFMSNGSMIFDNRKPLNTIETVDLLNELNDENQKLKNSDIVYEFEQRLINLININKELINDNRKLKEEVKELKAINARQKALLDELKRG